MRQVVLLASGLLFFTSPGLAQTPDVKSLVPKPACSGEMQGNISMMVTFNLHAKSFADAKAKFDEKLKQMDEFAKQRKIGKFELQSMNYNINPQSHYAEGASSEQSYQLMGRGSYVLDTADNAFSFAEFLESQKIPASINVSQHRSPYCNSSVAE